MKNLIYLLAIILTISVFTLNATSGSATPKESPQAPLVKLSGFKKDISTAD